MSEEEQIQDNEVNHEPELEVGKINIDQALELITTCHHEVTTCWNEYIREEYDMSYDDSRDDMVDIITIVEFIVSRLRDNQTNGLKELFASIEQAIETGDSNVKELILVGIIEGLRNNCDIENLDYHTLFNGWFNPKTQKLWDGMIYFWESPDPIEVKQQNMLNFRI